jgi:phosphatidate cytidylyltransferase
MIQKFKGIGKRVSTGLVLLLLVLLLLWVPELGLVFALFVAGLAALGTHEVYHLLQQQTIRPQSLLGSLAAFAIAFAAYWNAQMAAVALFAGAAAVSAAHIRSRPLTLASASGSVFGLVYPAWFGAHLLLLHRFDAHGPGLVMLLLVAVVLTDTGAFFTGKSIGKHKLAPVVSPNKTWEGSAGGFAAALIGMAVLFALQRQGLAFPEWSLSRYIATGALLSVVSQIGDLFESALKRSAGVKDSGRLFPGHGGVLDRCDGFLFAAPLLYYMAYF